MDRATSLVVAAMREDENPVRILTEEEAKVMLQNLHDRGEKIPRKLTPETFADIWYEIAYHLSK